AYFTAPRPITIARRPPSGGDRATAGRQAAAGARGGRSTRPVATLWPVAGESAATGYTARSRRPAARGAHRTLLRAARKPGHARYNDRSYRAFPSPSMTDVRDDGRSRQAGAVSSHFIRTIIEEDLRSGRHAGRP